MIEPTINSSPRKTFGVIPDVLLGVLFGGSLFFMLETAFVWLASWPEPGVFATILQGFVGGFFSLMSLGIFGATLRLMCQDRKGFFADILIAIGALVAVVLPWVEYAKVGGLTWPYLSQLVAPIALPWLYVVRLTPLVVFSLLIILAALDERRYQKLPQGQ